MAKKKKETELEYVQRVLLSSKISWRHQFSANTIYNDLKNNLNKLDLNSNNYSFLVGFKCKIDKMEKVDIMKIEELIQELKERMNFLMTQETKRRK